MPAESVIERLRRLEARATPGKWKAHRWLRQKHTFSEIQEASDGCTVIRESSNQNAELIVTTRNALPLLLAVAEAAIRLRSEWQEHNSAEHRAWTALRDLYAAADALRAGGSDV